MDQLLRIHHIQDIELEQLIEPSEPVEDDPEIKKFKRPGIFRTKELVHDKLMDYLRLLYRNPDNRNYTIVDTYTPMVKVGDLEVPKEEFVNAILQKASKKMLEHMESVYIVVPSDLKSNLEELVEHSIISSNDPRHKFALIGIITQVLVTLMNIR